MLDKHAGGDTDLGHFARCWRQEGLFFVENREPGEFGARCYTVARREDR